MKAYNLEPDVWISRYYQFESIKQNVYAFMRRNGACINNQFFLCRFRMVVLLIPELLGIDAIVGRLKAVGYAGKRPPRLLCNISLPWSQDPRSEAVGGDSKNRSEKTIQHEDVRTIFADGLSARIVGKYAEQC